MNKINALKMHVLGNDFIIIDSQEISNLSIAYSKLATMLSQHSVSIGCDQLIIYHINNEYDYISMMVYNRDGSKAKMCGNACICLSQKFFDDFNVRHLKVAIENNTLDCYYIEEGNISVNIGIANFKTKQLDTLNNFYSFLSSYNLDPKDVLYVDVGNPHLIIFIKLNKYDQEVIGKKLQTQFPNGINVNFAYKESDVFYLNVWERGTGITLACGSGACATFAAALKLGFVQSQAKIAFPLGNLKMMINQKNEIIMQGRAQYIMRGEVFL